ncbi:MAG: nucleotidyltransferase family protein [Bryobacteraceae bacterium]
MLLKAALLDGDAACQAYREWQTRGGLDRLDTGSYRLLPLVGHNLRRTGFEHEELGTLRGLHRKTWCENRLLFAKLAPAVAMLQQAGIPVILLKGVPLSLRYYNDVGLRPMHDLDLMVPELRAPEAMRLFDSAGWSRLWWFRYHLGPRDLVFRQALGYKDGSGREVDLHWHALYQATFHGADEAFWNSAEPLEFEGMRVQALCPSDELLHALVHGPMWNEIPPMRWVADAVTVARHGAIDWDRLVSLTGRLRVTLWVQAACGYLVRVFDAPIPERVLDGLARLPVDAAERVEFEASQKPLPAPKLSDTVRSICVSYQRRARGSGVLERMTDFPRFVCLCLQMEGPAELCARAAKWAARRVIAGVVRPRNWHRSVVAPSRDQT